ncbi:MAG: recombinase family protein [Oscillospiraceae bacterium]|nr:recombinase family protein [Oscillospiraceae bacterium]
MIKFNDNNLKLAFAYYRLSVEEASIGESSSISNQKTMVRAYCEQNGITILKEFVDDGYSGGNFNRPAFIEMVETIKQGKANYVLTKDLSRLGRDMQESSYYAEQFFPENNIRYIATHDGFDNLDDNPMNPFRFAMNEAYLRDGSRKIKEVLKSKREHGEYCACPPYGYKKNPDDKTKLIFDENTSPIVARIFKQAASGDSSRKIALDLNEDGIIPPLKYRVLYRDDFNAKGAARASDEWNYTTVKRILKNKVYLGHTILGKTRKASLKSQKKIAIPQENWIVSSNTHPAIVSEDIFDKAQLNLGKGTRNYRQYDHVRKSIFSGIVKCNICGYSLCSAGTVYKGEREKYWYLSCTRNRKGVANACPGTRIRYADLLELVRHDLNSLLGMTDKQQAEFVDEIIYNLGSDTHIKNIKNQINKAQARIEAIDKILIKLYGDNAEGKIDDERLARMTKELAIETETLNKTIFELTKQVDDASSVADSYEQFFDLVKQHSQVETLDRDILLAFVDKIVIGERILPAGYKKLTHPDTTPFEQEVKIYYKFIGELEQSSENNGNCAIETA